MYTARPVAFIAQVNQAITRKTAFAVRPLHPQRLSAIGLRKVGELQNMQHVVGFLPSGKNPLAGQAGFAPDK